MNKEEFRIKYKYWRSLLTEDERRVKSSEITKHALDWLKLKQSTCVHVFISSAQHQEPDTSQLIATLLEENDSIQLCTSKLVVGEPRQWICKVDRATQWQKNQWNILEPVENNIVDAKEIEVIFIPLLAYDIRGNRVGYGKGYYDELIQWCTKDVKKIGWSFFNPDDELIPKDTWDKTLDGVITPDGLITFESN